MHKILLVLTIAAYGAIGLQASDLQPLDVDSQQVLEIPGISSGDPAAGKRVVAKAPEFASTSVFHTIYLPPGWTPTGKRYPIIFEYTGNRFPQSGSSGQTEDAALGYGLTAGKCIWVSLPYVSADHQKNEVTWWGDELATVEYAKLNVPRIIETYNADPNAVILCGFSRGAIGVSYIGLHDAEIAKLWTVMVTHDHFDGVRAWGGTDWGQPLSEYQQRAASRLKRIEDRPLLVIQNGDIRATRSFVKQTLGEPDNVSFMQINTSEILGVFPNSIAKSAHTDRWLIPPSPSRSKVWAWINRSLAVD